MKKPTWSVIGSLLFSITAFAAENGVGRGGGNAVVCFKKPVLAEELTVRDSGTGQVVFYKSIPRDRLREIRSIVSYDLYLATLPQGDGKSPRKIIGLSGNPESTLDEEFERYLRRFSGIFSSVKMDLEIYARMIPFSKVQIHLSGLQPVYDLPAIGRLQPGCILATMFIQTGKGDSTEWGYDQELFELPQHSKLSRIVFLLHERTYLKGRSERDLTDSAMATQIVGRILDPNTTFKELLSDWLKIDSRIKYGPYSHFIIDWPPMKNLSILYNYVSNRERADGKLAALEYYRREFQEKLMATEELPLAFRRSIDENLTAWYSGTSPQLIFYEYDLLDWKIPIADGYPIIEAPAEIHAQPQ